MNLQEKTLRLALPLHICDQILKELVTTGVKHSTAASIILSSIVTDTLYDMVEGAVHVKKNLPPMDQNVPTKESLERSKRNEKLMTRNDVGRALIADQSSYARIVSGSAKSTRLLSFLEDESSLTPEEVKQIGRRGKPRTAKTEGEKKMKADPELLKDVDESEDENGKDGEDEEDEYMEENDEEEDDDDDEVSDDEEEATDGFLQKLQKLEEP